MGLVYGISTGSKLDALVQVLKCRVPTVGFKPFALQDEILGFEFCPNCSCAEGRVYCHIVSQPLLFSSMFFVFVFAFFSSVAWHVGVAQLVFSCLLLLFSRETHFICSCKFSESGRQGDFRISLHHYLEWECWKLSYLKAEQNFSTWKGLRHTKMVVVLRI